MAIADLENALKFPEGWKRSEALRTFGQTEFGLEALPLLEKALDDESILVVSEAIEVIGKLGSKALIGESADMNTPRGLVARLFSLGNHVWSYSGYQNCYGACLRALVKLGYKSRPLVSLFAAILSWGTPTTLLNP